MRPTSIFNFFKKVGGIPPEEETGEFLDRLAVFDEEGENISEIIRNTEIYVKPIYPTCLEDISQLEPELKRGNILIVHLNKLHEKRRAIEQIRGILSFIGGDVGHIVGGETLIVTPSFISIWRDM
ncbi:MAG: cell division protein SepF [Promethearchaeota archaeon]